MYRNHQVKEVSEVPGREWVSVSLPEDLVGEVDATMERIRRWTSRAEFVREAVRRYIEDLKEAGP
ncbi:MAG: hypothetical protein DRI26_09020 [Chloroflexi bacterium]|nr:MAG: hypothetical protein DRI26_09020 [Chloroflexota bacterium]